MSREYSELELEERQEIFDNNSKRIKKEYFINPLGKVIKFKGDLYEEYVSLHYEIAEECFPDMKNPEDYMMNTGWVLIGSSVYSHPIIHIEPTQAQLNTLDKLGLLDRLTILKGKYYEKYMESL